MIIEELGRERGGEREKRENSKIKALNSISRKEIGVCVSELKSTIQL